MRKIFHGVLILVVLSFLSFFYYDFINAKDETTISFQQADNFIEEILNDHFQSADKEYQQLEFLYALQKRINQKNITNKNISVYSQAIHSQIKKLETQLDEVQKIVVWYSENLEKIYGYYKWNIDEEFLLITANSHGAYEYGTYLTAMDLIDYFDKRGKTQWFIIPTLNPDGLQIAIDDNFSEWFYLEGRWNKNNVDINRNFCTQNFTSWEYIKSFWWEEQILSKWNTCWDQLETQIIDSLFQKFRFSHVLDFHSLGAIIFIPDNGLNDPKIVNFAKQTQKLLWNNYDFHLEWFDSLEQNYFVEKYEFDEGGKSIYTGFMAQYIYEKYNIPAIVIEFEYHGRIEKRTRNLEKLLK